MDFRVCLEYGSGYGVFCLKIHQNNIFFYFFKIIFGISTSKRSKNIKKLIFKKNN
jgi:hypothetical protein